MFDLYGNVIGDTIDFRGHGSLTAQFPWPPTTVVSAGQGVVFSKTTDTYSTLFMEVYPPEGGFIRGEGPTPEACEAAAWEKYQRQVDCVDGHSHQWEPRGYKNGAGFCKHCGTFKSGAFTAEELGQFCQCGVATTWSWAEVDGEMVFGCEHHPVKRPPDQLSMLEKFLGVDVLQGSATPVEDQTSPNPVSSSFGVPRPGDRDFDPTDEEQGPLEQGWAASRRYNLEHTEEDVKGCSCGMADHGAPGHDGDPNG